MQVNPDEFRRRYAEISDDTLLEINRDDLVDVARDLYDAELNRRGLTPKIESGATDPLPGQSGPEGDLVLAAEFGSTQELAVARSMLNASGIPTHVQADFSGILGSTEEDMKLYVPSSYLEQAHELLVVPLTDEELAAQAEAAGDEFAEDEDEEADEAGESDEDSKS